MKSTFTTLLQRSRSDNCAYSLTFYDGSIDDKDFPIRGLNFVSQASLRQFLDSVLGRKDSQWLIQRSDSTSLAVEFCQSIDDKTLKEINKVAGSIL